MLRPLQTLPVPQLATPRLTIADVMAAEGLRQRARSASGQPIGYLMHKALAHPELISLAAGFVDQTSLPVEATSQALQVVFSDQRRARTALQYGTTAGHMPLREAVLDQLV